MTRLLMLTNVHRRSQGMNSSCFNGKSVISFTHKHLRDEFYSMGGHERAVFINNLPTYKGDWDMVLADMHRPLNYYSFTRPWMVVFHVGF